jgi:hypothetical protein
LPSVATKQRFCNFTVYLSTHLESTEEGELSRDLGIRFTLGSGSFGLFLKPL